MITPAPTSPSVPIKWQARAMIFLGTLWSAFCLGIPQADSFGFFPDDLPMCLLFWLLLGWPGQVTVAIFYPGPLRIRMKAAVLSFLLSFAVMAIWLGADEAAFKAFHPAHEMETFQRDRWWPYSSFTLVVDGDEEWGYGYWAI
ncbi:MAG: hypothetical protein HQ519_13700 [Planctomycetes bacterium]|nr:hypothetical protein [Planctomycetota bacterium]